jgi:hypothetical protein
LNGTFCQVRGQEEEWEVESGAGYRREPKRFGG